ncbi:T1SS secreted agglutinin RTX [Vibrio ishigakensis]|uniref:T1SS secreted agglutinin RTX n=1 Tax=Vibrio ishigakensis TaxID=1481914 RepID=A0A0B8QMQ5_9VIBR|nr:T1SS secreted agglutinin RTX [Vibrio ishigakensis]
MNQDGIEHTRTTVNEDGEIVYGFEDLYGGGDADYSDFNFTIDVGEVNSQIYSGEITVGESGSVVLPTTAISQTIELEIPQGLVDSFDIEVSATATELSNDDSETVSQTITIDIEHAPEAEAVAATVDEDGSIIITQEQLLANASDLDGDALTASNLATEDDNISVTDNGDGTFTLTPNADFNGEIEFTFDVSDGDQLVSTNLNLTVNPVNDDPTAEDVSYTINEDGTLTFTDEQLLAGADDIDGDALSVSDVSYTGADGVFTDNGDGTYEFAPNANFNGEVSLDFTVTDGQGGTVDANIDVTVLDVNDPPVAGSTSYQMNEDGTIDISPEQLLANSSDVDGTVSLDSVSYTGTDGILTQNEDGSVTFAPNENFNGDVTLDVVVIDDDGATASTTAGIEVIAVNDAPVAGQNAYTVNEDGSITISQEQLLAGSTDVEGDALTASNLTVDGNANVTQNEDGSFTITPDANFNGDIDMHFDITDGTDTIQATADLTVNPVNDLPTAEDVSYTINEDGTLTFTDEQLLAGADDIDGDALSVSDVSYTGADGVFTDNGDGTYEFAPNANFNGEVSLDFTVSDGQGGSVDANIDVTVLDVNDPPVAGSTSYQMNEDGTIDISPEQLLANSSDVDGTVSLDSVSYTGTDGILTQNEDGSVTFAPNENFNGDVTLDVVVIDDDGATANTTAGIDVIAVNDAPVAGQNAYTVNEDGSITISQEQLLAGSSDVEGDALTASNLTVDGNAEVTQNEDAHSPSRRMQTSTAISTCTLISPMVPTPSKRPQTLRLTLSTTCQRQRMSATPSMKMAR